MERNPLGDDVNSQESTAAHAKWQMPFWTESKWFRIKVGSRKMANSQNVLYNQKWKHHNTMDSCSVGLFLGLYIFVTPDNVVDVAFCNKELTSSEVVKKAYFAFFYVVFFVFFVCFVFFFFFCSWRWVSEIFVFLQRHKDTTEQKHDR